MIFCKLRAIGRVQGVNYRFFVLQCARKLNISGYVKNLGDDSVEIVAEAKDAATLSEFKRMISSSMGSAMGHEVSELRVESEEESAKQRYEGFQIDY
jgi:acylphosphatase